MKDPLMQAILTVTAGNPGAMTVIKKLEWFSKWHEMVYHLEEHGPRGDELWSLYKDEYHQDIFKLGDELENRLAKDRRFRHFREQEMNSPKSNFKRLPKYL